MCVIAVATIVLRPLIILIQIYLSTKVPTMSKGDFITEKLVSLGASPVCDQMIIHHSQ